MKLQKLTIILASTLLCSAVVASNNNASSHAPIGVMGDHMHKKGEWMTAYRYGNMHMDGNRDGTDRVSLSDVHAEGFMVVPTKMDMEMHMFGLMYGVSDNITLMAMLPYVEKDMDHRSMMGMKFSTATSGLGDAKLAGLFSIADSAETKAHITLGISVPTGSIDERGDTPAMDNAKLPYPMQLGSGTVDPSIGITLTQRVKENWSVGGQASATFRLYENSQEYSLGNELKLSSWAAYDITPEVSVSARLDGHVWGDISGEDAELNPMMVPTARTDLRGGKRLDLGVGINVALPGESLDGTRLAVEYLHPVFQDLDGPQLETDERLIVGLQYAF